MTEKYEMLSNAFAKAVSVWSSMSEEQKEDLENEFVVSINNLVSVLDTLAGDIHEIAKERRA